MFNKRCCLNILPVNASLILKSFPAFSNRISRARNVSSWSRSQAEICSLRVYLLVNYLKNELRINVTEQFLRLYVVRTFDTYKLSVYKTLIY